MLQLAEYSIPEVAETWSRWLMCAQGGYEVAVVDVVVIESDKRSTNQGRSP
jgi:hypothetical protein